MRSRWMLAASLVAGAWLSAVSAYAQTSDEEWLKRCREQRNEQFVHCEVRPIEVTAAGTLDVDARPNGGVQVTGWDDARVAGSARIQVQADNEDEARRIASAIVIDASSARVSASGPKTRSPQSWSVTFVLSVPRRIDMQLQSVNGPISAAGISGQLRATTTNGPITLRELSGDVRARATNGPINVELAGTTWEGTGLDAETTNGPVRIGVPEGYSAQVKVGTTNGPLRLDVPVPPEARDRRAKSIDVAIGSGGAPIRAVTTNGPVTLERR